jgi:Holliday junction resolvasome RuvABC endonuclease subunit
VSQTIRILGIDPSLKNTGIAIADYDLATATFEVIHIDLFDTEPDKTKQVRKSSDDVSRMHEGLVGVMNAIDHYKPAFASGEVPVASQSARGAFSNGGCHMMLAAVLWRIPLVQVTPMEVKVASAGPKHAAKEEIIEWAVSKWPTLPWHTHKRLGKVILSAKNEHMADACAAIAAGTRTQQFKQAVAMMRGAHAA